MAADDDPIDIDQINGPLFQGHLERLKRARDLIPDQGDLQIKTVLGIKPQLLHRIDKPAGAPGRLKGRPQDRQPLTLSFTTAIPMCSLKNRLKAISLKVRRFDLKAFSLQPKPLQPVCLPVPSSRPARRVRSIVHRFLSSCHSGTCGSSERSVPDVRIASISPR